MIKREHIKQAIDAIASRDPEIGHVLDEMLSGGRIDVPQRPTSDPDFCFLFDNQIVPVRKFIFINEGTVPIERGLLIKYGELLHKQQLMERSRVTDFQQAARDTWRAGLKLMVSYEIDLATDRLTQQSEPRDPSPASLDTDAYPTRRELVDLLIRVKQDKSSLKIPSGDFTGNRDPVILYHATVDKGRPAYFTRFPYCMDALIQVADINLEFFHVRFILNLLIRGHDKNLFACVVNNKITGMLYLESKHALFYRGIEIKYIATLRGRRTESLDWTGVPIRGVGRFLVSGTWLLWKTRHRDAREIVLDSELVSRQFYEAMGFHPKGPSRYALKSPRPNLLRTILEMADNCPGLEPPVFDELSGLVGNQLKSLRKKPGKDRVEREKVVALARSAILCRSHNKIVQTAIQTLLGLQPNVPEAARLLDLVEDADHILPALRRETQSTPIGIIKDDRFRQHLEGIFHLESSKRYEAILSVLNDPGLEGKLVLVKGRMATPEELTWVHTPEYIATVAETAGKSLTSFDLDTQTTGKSYEVACLAVGSVFSLLDEILKGSVSRGFAAVRPPGHHAEPDKAMGFCLFNNVALGASYLRRRYGVGRVMIVDIDAHHGNGTQRAFYDSDEVLFISVHQFPGFPGTGNFGEVGIGGGEGYTVNVPLPKGQGDRDFLRVIHFLVRPLARVYEPEIILVSCGFDLYLHDRLAQMRVTPEGFGQITALLLDMAEEVSTGRIVLIMEGGYSVEGIRECGLRVMKVLSGQLSLDRAGYDRVKAEDPPKLSALKKVMEIHRKYWPVLNR